MTENPDRIERTLELLIYAPIGIGLFLKDTAPTFVDMFVARGRAEVDKRQDDAQQRVTTARSLGQVAIAFGPPVVRQRVEQTITDACRRAESILGAVIPGNAGSGSAGTTAAAPTEAPVAPVAPVAFAPAAPVPTPAAPAEIPTNGDAVTGAADEWRSTTPYSSTPPTPDGGSAALPIPGYDALSASQVVERLTGLTGAELDAVHAYEMANRQRRTILGKIEQLAG